MLYMNKYEMHCHTKEASACASADGETQALYYKSRGYKGIIVTDHFFNGNSCAPSNLSWEEKVNILTSGYEHAKACGDKIGLDVFFGWEYGHRGADLLTYGLDKQWLLAHPDVMEWDVNTYCDMVHEAGGIIVHAHPFREDWYIDMIRLFPRKCDGCEVINACRKEIENKMASFYADMYGMHRTGGSDNHHANQSRLSGIACEEEIKDINHFKDIILGDRYHVIDEYK